MGYYGSFGQSIVPDPSTSTTQTGTLPGGSIPPGGTMTSGTSGGAMPPVAPGSIQTWSYAPIIIAAMQQNPSVFMAPMNQEDAWHVMAVQLLVSMGYADPGHETDALGAAYALAQAFGYYWLPGPGNNSFQDSVRSKQRDRMYDLLNYDLSAMAVYKQLHPQSLPGIKLSSTQLRQMWSRMAIPTPGTPGAMPPGAVPPAAAASSTPWLLIGGVAAVGAAAYFLI